MPKPREIYVRAHYRRVSVPKPHWIAVDTRGGELRVLRTFQTGLLHDKATGKPVPEPVWGASNDFSVTPLFFRRELTKKIDAKLIESKAVRLLWTP